MNRAVMNVAVTSSREYLRYLAVLLASIYENHPDILVHCYVLHDALTEEDERTLTEYVRNCGHEITFIKIDSKILEGFPVPYLWPYSIFYRVMFHFFLPKHLERVLVLGIDIIVNKNIWDFYNSDFEGNYLIGAGTPDLIGKERHRPDKTHKYIFNADVLIWNLEMFRENISVDDYMEAIGESDGWISNDEMLLNYMFWDKVKLVDASEYNFKYLSQAKINKFPPITSAAESPAILHYIYYDKPWRILMNEDEVKRAAEFPIGVTEHTAPIFTEYSNQLKAVWWRYAKMTPFYDDMYREMQCAKGFIMSSMPYVSHTQRRAIDRSIYGALYRKLLYATNLSDLLAEYCSSHNVKSVAIYGYGDLGQLIYKKLTAKNSPVSVNYVIDRKPIDDPGVRRVESGLERYDPVDLIIVTALKDYEIIKEQLAGRADCPIRSLSEIADEITEHHQ